MHVLLGDFVEAIVEGLPLQASLFIQPCRDNALYLLSLVDELILDKAFDLLLIRLDPSLTSLLSFSVLQLVADSAAYLVVSSLPVLRFHIFGLFLDIY